MERSRRRLSRKSSQDWQQQRVGDQTRYLTTEDGSTVVVARQSANAFCWEEPKEHASSVSNLGAEPESADVALHRTLIFLRKAYRNNEPAIGEIHGPTSRRNDLTRRRAANESGEG